MTHTQSSICTGTMCEARVSRSVSAAAVVPESGRAFGIAISALRCVARRVPVVLASPVTVRRRARVQTKHSIAIRDRLKSMGQTLSIPSGPALTTAEARNPSAANAEFHSYPTHAFP